MYIMVDNAGDIVAFDETFSKAFDAKNITEFYAKMANRDFSFEDFEFVVNEDGRRYRFETVGRFVGMFGELLLCRSLEENVKSDIEDDKERSVSAVPGMAESSPAYQDTEEETLPLELSADGATETTSQDFQSSENKASVYDASQEEEAAQAPLSASESAEMPTLQAEETIPLLSDTEEKAESLAEKSVSDTVEENEEIVPLLSETEDVSTKDEQESRQSVSVSEEEIMPLLDEIGGDETLVTPEETVHEAKEEIPLSLAVQEAIGIDEKGTESVQKADEASESLDKEAPIDLDLDALLLEENENDAAKVEAEEGNIQKDKESSEDTASTKEPSSATVEVVTIDPVEKSASIGITPKEYEELFEEFGQEAILKESSLRSDSKELREKTALELAHLAQLLRIEALAAPLKEIVETEESGSREALVRHYYERLGAVVLRATRQEGATMESKQEYFGSTKKQSIEEEAKENATRSLVQEESSVATAEASDIRMYEPIVLDDVEPEHFDFKLEDAAEELNLPAELIEEFVIDFIAQAKSETPRMLLAYQQGDLETVQKLGHLLKGAAANLRIEPLAETLYDIQFNDDIERVPQLMRRYWARFIAFDAMMKIYHQRNA